MKMDFLLILLVLTLFIVQLFLRVRKFINVDKNKELSKNSNSDSNSNDKPASNMNNIPGPSTLPVIGILHHFLKPGIDVIDLVEEWALKYGKLCRARVMTKNFVAVFDPEYIQKILTSTNPGHQNFPTFLWKMVTSFDFSKSLFFADYPVWKFHRKILSRLFTQNGIENQIKLQNRHTKKLVDELTQKIESNSKDFKVCKMLHQNALEMILELIFDREMLSLEEQNNFMKNLRTFQIASTRRLREPWLLLPPVWWLHPLSRQHNKATTEMMEVTNKMASKYAELKKKQPKQNISDADENNDVGIRKFKCMMEEMVDGGFSDQEILQETLSIIYGGHETTSWSISYLLLTLALNPEIQERCRKEVDLVFDSKIKPDSDDDDGRITVKDLSSSSMEYLDRCVKENLRQVPIGFAFIRRLDVPFELDNDLVLDAGTTLLFSPWITHRNPEIYPDPEKFDPDRFLPEECKKRHPYAYIPFSAGIRNCLGWKVAPLTIKLVTAYMLRYFKISTTDKWEDLEFVFEISVTTKKDVNLILKRRPEIL